MTQTRHPFGVKSDPEWGASPAETNSRHELPGLFLAFGEHRLIA